MSKLLKYLIGLNYIILAFVIYFVKDLAALKDFPEWARIAMPVLLCIYGIFRLYRAYKNEFEEKDEEE
jgi:uncharacterized membrane protein YjfL (UPF0719 family)